MYYLKIALNMCKKRKEEVNIMKGDFHIHSMHSDGTHSVDFLCSVYKAENYNFIAITDHYTIPSSLRDDKVLEMKKELYGLDIILGSEQIALVNGEWVHLLCYFNSNKDLSKGILELLKGQENFTKAFNERVKEIMISRGVDIPDIDYNLIDPTSYMPILMEVCKRTGKTIKDTRREFFTLMNDLDYEGPTQLDFNTLIDEVHKSGGLVALAHPYQFKEETVLECLKSVDALECIYGTYTKEQIDNLKKLAKEYNVLITAGSDFHSEVRIDGKKHGDIGSVALTGEDLYKFIKKLKGDRFNLSYDEFVKKYSNDIDIKDCAQSHNPKEIILSNKSLKDKVKEWLMDIGVILKKDKCGEHYFATYEGKMVVLNLDDLSLNSTMFRLNSSKRQSMSILNHFNVPHVEVLDLSNNLRDALVKCNEYLMEYGKFVIRGDKGTCGTNTFIVENNNDISIALGKLFEKNVKPLMSPYYDAPYEYRVYYLKDRAELVIQKERNPDTGKHNLTTGAIATKVESEDKIFELEKICHQVASIFELNFAAIDILDTPEGFKVIEFGIPNIKRFSNLSAENEKLAKELYQKAFLYKMS